MIRCSGITDKERQTILDFLRSHPISGRYLSEAYDSTKFESKLLDVISELLVKRSRNRQLLEELAETSSRAQFNIKKILEERE